MKYMSTSDIFITQYSDFLVKQYILKSFDSTYKDKIMSTCVLYILLKAQKHFSLSIIHVSLFLFLIKSSKKYPLLMY